MVSCHLAFVRLVSSLGDSSVAAHGVAIQVESFSYLIGDAFAAATAALVGQSLGAGRPDLARLCGWAGVIRSAVGMGLVGIGFVMFGPMICGLFTESKQVADSAGSVVRLMGLAEAPLGAMIVLGGILRGAGDTRAMLVISLSGILGVRIPLAFWLSSESLGWGLWGMWLAMLLDVVVRFLMLGARFLGGAWMSSRV
jgi:Na+-driven multidrug efflux pump